MYNEDIYKKLEEVYGEQRMPMVTDIISKLYDIKYIASRNVISAEEYDYERQWWMDKHKNIVKLLDV